MHGVNEIIAGDGIPTVHLTVEDFPGRVIKKQVKRWTKPCARYPKGHLYTATREKIIPPKRHAAQIAKLLHHIARCAVGRDPVFRLTPEHRLELANPVPGGFSYHVDPGQVMFPWQTRRPGLYRIVIEM